MKLLLGALFLQLPVVAVAVDRAQSFAATPSEYYATGEQVDHVRFVVHGAKVAKVRITISGKKRTAGCATRYCRTNETQQAMVHSVVLHGPASTIPFANGETLDLAPGNYMLAISVTGIGTGRYAGAGPYSVTLFRVVQQRQASDD